MGKHIADYHLVPNVSDILHQEQLTREVESERNIFIPPQDLLLPSKLNEGQKNAYNLILQEVFSSSGRSFFIDGPDGTGKTFLYRSLLATLRSQGYIAIAVATSGVAASILPGGRTAHSRFKIPLDFSQNKTCQLSKQSSTAKLIAECKLILWDEASMAKREAIEALDDLLKDIMESDSAFGGKEVVFGGDFRQTLPVIEKASKQVLIQSCLVNSPLWSEMEKIRLTENMRAILDTCFTQFLLRIGEGSEPVDENNQISLTNNMVIPYYNKEESLDRMDNILPIREIKDGMKTWTCKITVQEKQQITYPSTHQQKKQKFVFIDSEGSQVEGIIFSSDIPTMSPRIQPCKKYLISNADVRTIPEKYRTSSLTMQWVITTRTVIEELPDDESIIPVKFNYTEFKDLAPYVDQKDKSVDVLAVAIHALEKKAFTKNNRSLMVQEFVIVNEQLQPMMLSLWGEFIDNEGQKIVENLHRFPPIIGRRLKVSYYNGVTLSTWFDSAILVDPPVQGARELKNWAMRNSQSLSNIIDHKTYDNYNPDISLQPEKKITLVANVLPTQKSAWVKASFSFENIFQKYWYMTCSKCYRSTSASCGVQFICNSCKEKRKAEPRCRFELDLTDQSGMITASLFGDIAEKLLTFTAFEAMEYYNKNADLPLEKIHQDLKLKQFLAHVKPSAAQMADGKQRFTIIYYCDSSEKESTQQAIADHGVGSTSSPHQFPTAKLTSPETPPSKARLCLDDKFQEFERTGENDFSITECASPKKTRLT